MLKLRGTISGSSLQRFQRLAGPRAIEALEAIRDVVPVDKLIAQLEKVAAKLSSAKVHQEALGFYTAGQDTSNSRDFKADSSWRKREKTERSRLWEAGYCHYSQEDCMWLHICIGEAGSKKKQEPRELARMARV
jgi:hypothetical protein